MPDKIKVSKEIYDIISEFTNLIRNHYIKEEINFINRLNEKMKYHSPEIQSELIRAMAYSPIICMIREQFNILHLSLSDKSITKSEFKEIFFKQLWDMFNSIPVENNTIN